MDYSAPKCKYWRLGAGFTKPLCQNNAAYNAKSQNAQHSIFWTQMKGGGGGIRTHDDTGMRRTLSEHGYGRSDRLGDIFHGSKEELTYLVQNR